MDIRFILYIGPYTNTESSPVDKSHIAKILLIN